MTSASKMRSMSSFRMVWILVMAIVAMLSSLIFPTVLFTNLGSLLAASLFCATFLHVVDCSSQVAHHVLVSCIVLELDVTFRPSGLVLIPLESASVELVPLWAPVFTEVIAVIVVTVVALFVAWGSSSSLYC